MYVGLITQRGFNTQLSVVCVAKQSIPYTRTYVLLHKIHKPVCCVALSQLLLLPLVREQVVYDGFLQAFSHHFEGVTTGNTARVSMATFSSFSTCTFCGDGDE